LPTFFTQLVGVMDQGVRATATAEVRFGLASTCIKPFAIPDKWDEHRPITKLWDPNDTFERYAKGVLLDPADIYRPPVSPSDPGSGYDTTPGAEGSDYGTPVTIKPSHGRQRLEAGFYALVRLGDSTGEDDIIENILGCNPTEIGPGTVLPVEPGARPGPTARAVQEIIDDDLGASWSGPSLEAGPFGGVIGSRYGTSPRIVPIGVFNPNVWDADPGGGPGGPGPTDEGPNTVTVTQVIGIFLESTRGNEITGRVVPYPATGHFGSGGIPGEANVINIILVR
jgi:hypothetical protein